MRRIGPLACASCASLLFAALPAWSQEMSEASYVGALEGAVQACVAAFPERAASYRQSLQRLAGCHMSDRELAAWRQRLREQDGTRREYAQAYTQGVGSLSGSRKARLEQCASLETLQCDPDARLVRPER